MLNDLKSVYGDWKKQHLLPALFERLDELFPEYEFRRKRGASGERWVSPLKIDLTNPKVKTPEKTVVSYPDMKFREQGDWERGVGVIDLYMQRSGIDDFGEACRELAARLCIPFPAAGGGETYVRTREEDSKRRLILETLEDYFCWNLLNNTQSFRAGHVRDYLTKTRGFTVDDLKALRLGYVPDWPKVLAYIASRREHFSEAEVNAACPVLSDEGTTPVGTVFPLAIPYRCGGELRGFLFRRIKGEGQKYFAVRGMERKDRFFGVPERIGEGDTVVVVEGEIDCLRIRSLGKEGMVPVAIGGDSVTGNRRAQMDDLLGRGVARLVFWLDMDATNGGGANVYKRYIKTLASVHTVKDIDIGFEEIYVADTGVEWIGDPDSFISEFGKEKFLEVIEKAAPYPEYFSKYWMGQPENKIVL